MSAAVGTESSSQANANKEEGAPSSGVAAAESSGPTETNEAGAREEPPSASGESAVAESGELMPAQQEVGTSKVCPMLFSGCHCCIKPPTAGVSWDCRSLQASIDVGRLSPASSVSFDTTVVPSSQPTCFHASMLVAAMQRTGKQPSSGASRHAKPPPAVALSSPSSDRGYACDSACQ